MALNFIRVMVLGLLVAFGGVGIGKGAKTTIKSDIEEAFDAVVLNAQQNYKYFFQAYDDAGKKIEAKDVENKSGQTVLLYALKQEEINVDSDMIKKFLDAMDYGAKPYGIKQIFKKDGSTEFADDDGGHGYSSSARMQALNFQEKNGGTVLYVALKKKRFYTASLFIQKGANLPEESLDIKFDKQLWLKLKKIFEAGMSSKNIKSFIVEQQWMFYNALNCKDLKTLFENLKKVNENKMPEILQGSLQNPCDDVLFVVNEIIKNEKIDEALKGLQKTLLKNIKINGPLYRFYTTLSRINIESDGKTVNGVVLDNVNVATAIKDAQNKIASFLLKKLINAANYYSSWSRNNSTFFHDYDRKNKPQALLSVNENISKQLDLIVPWVKRQGLDFGTIEVVSNKSTDKSFVFRAKGIDEKCVVVGNEKTSIKDRLERALLTIDKVYKNVWLFDNAIRKKGNIKIDAVGNIKNFMVDANDWNDIKNILGKEIKISNENIYSGCVLQKNILTKNKAAAFSEDLLLSGFSDYLVNVYTAIRLLNWARAINQKKQQGLIYDAIKKLEEALELCTGPTVKFDELKRAIELFAVVAKGNKKLYEVTNLNELSGGEFKSAYEEEKKNKEGQKKGGASKGLEKALGLLKAKLLFLATQLKNNS